MTVLITFPTVRDYIAHSEARPLGRAFRTDNNRLAIECEYIDKNAMWDGVFDYELTGINESTMGGNPFLTGGARNGSAFFVSDRAGLYCSFRGPTIRKGIPNRQ